MKNEVITLVTVLDSKEDADGFRTEEKIKKVEVFADIKSVGRMEYYEAARSGVQASIIFVVDEDDFKLSEHKVSVNEKNKMVKASKIIHNDTTYMIHRTFVKNHRLMEITCSEVE